MAVALTKSGKSLQLVKRAYGELQKGQLKSANKLLAKVGNDGSLLLEEIDYLLRRYKVVQEYYQEKDDTLTYRVNELYQKERELRSQQVKAENELRLEESNLGDQRRKLTQIQRDLAKAKTTKEVASTTGVAAGVGLGILGAILTVVAPPVGLATLAAAGGTALGGGIVAASAQDDINKCNRNIEHTEEKIATTKRTINKLGYQINDLSSDIKRVKNERDRYHTENTRVKEVVVFLQKARVFWSEFSVATEAGTQRTELLRKLITKAEKNEQYTIFKSGGMKRVAQSFLDAWEDFEEMTNTGENYLFRMEFECGQCYVACDELPHLEDQTMICERCALARDARMRKRKCVIS